ncbi:MAG: lysine 2,3-aminomutase, partial [Deltaproteobacteria bacterium]|nr:lysine 2,3-aminomutase [Deltaproteobacteria bacterium]
KQGIDIIDGLRGHTTGYAIPTFVIDAPGGGGKIPVGPENVVRTEPGKIVLKNYQGKIYEYSE